VQSSQRLDDDVPAKAKRFLRSRATQDEVIMARGRAGSLVNWRQRVCHAGFRVCGQKQSIRRHEWIYAPAGNRCWSRPRAWSRRKPQSMSRL